MTSSLMRQSVRRQQQRDLEALNRLRLIADERKEAYLVHFDRFLDAQEAMRDVREGIRNAEEALREIEQIGL